MTNLHPTSYLMEKTETTSPKVRNETREPTLPTPIHHCPGTPRQSSKLRREDKIIQLGK
jgi:hypothetical protein